MPTGTNITPDLITRMRLLRAEGMSCTAIAIRLGLAWGTVQRHLRKKV